MRIFSKLFSLILIVGFYLTLFAPNAIHAQADEVTPQATCGNIPNPANGIPENPSIFNSDTGIQALNNARAVDGVNNPFVKPAGYDSLSNEEKFRLIINHERTSRGLSAFGSNDPVLAQVARNHSKVLVDFNIFAHDTGIDGTFSSRMSAFSGGKGEIIGYAGNVEEIAYYFIYFDVAPYNIGAAWGHRMLIFGCFTHIGIGVVNKGFQPMLTANLLNNAAYTPGTLDTTPPTVTITNPVFNTPSGTFTATANVTDANPIRHVAFYKDNSFNASPPVPTGTANGSTYSFNFSGLSNGTHTITVVAFDRQNNFTRQDVTFTVGGSGQPLTSGKMNILNAPVRIADVRTGTSRLTATGDKPKNGDSSSVNISIGGTNGIPANATGVLGLLTNFGCTGGGNFRFWTGSNVPNAANLNVPGAFPALNLSTNFIAALDTNGAVNLGLGSGSAVNCGYIVDIVGYITPDANGNIFLLTNTARMASTIPADGLNSPKLTATGTTPANSGTGVVEFTIGGVSGIPANAKGVFGVLTNVGCNGGGNFRFWTGTTIPDAANLNVPGAMSALNLSTGFTAPLDANGKVKLGLGSGSAVNCGYVVDVIGYTTSPTTSGNLYLLSSTKRAAATVSPLNNAKLTAVGTAPTNTSTDTFEFSVSGLGVPVGAKGIIGVLTNVGCSGGGNLRFFTGNFIPNTSHLNVPGAMPSLNLSTGFTALLDSGGKVKLGLGSGSNINCGYVVDVMGYIS
jgi:uncharacterized protein YkwD